MKNNPGTSGVLFFKRLIVKRIANRTIFFVTLGIAAKHLS